MNPVEINRAGSDGRSDFGRDWPGFSLECPWEYLRDRYGPNGFHRGETSSEAIRLPLR